MRLRTPYVPMERTVAGFAAKRAGFCAPIGSSGGPIPLVIRGFAGSNLPFAPSKAPHEGRRRARCAWWSGFWRRAPARARRRLGLRRPGAQSEAGRPGAPAAPHGGPLDAPSPHRVAPRPAEKSRKGTRRAPFRAPGPFTRTLRWPPRAVGPPCWGGWAAEARAFPDKPRDRKLHWDAKNALAPLPLRSGFVLPPE